MRQRLPSLNALRAFETSARCMSFTKAAAELGVTQGAVSRQVKTLESELGVALFLRHVRRIELTKDGRTLFAGVRQALDQLERSVGQVDRHKATGVLTVSALPTFAMNWLMPRLEDFSIRNPSIELHLVTSIGAVDFSRDNIDLAIRVGHIADTDDLENAARIDLKMTENSGDWRSHRLMADELIAVASPGLVTESLPLNAASELLSYPLLHVATRSNAWSDYFAALGLQADVGPEEPKFGHYFMVLGAARRGDGIAVVPRILVEEDLSSGRLVALLDQSVPSAGSYYLLCPTHRWHLPMVRAFRDWISKQAVESTADRSGDA